VKSDDRGPRTLSAGIGLISVSEAGQAAEQGLLCYKSKRDSVGYQRKLAWLEQRFEEGPEIRIIREDDRSVGFIEDTPGEFAWRPVHAPGFLFIHCVWVVGRAKERGYGSHLLNACLEDARAREKRGVAMLAKKGRHLVGKKLFLNHGFKSIDRGPLSFELLAKAFPDDPAPTRPYDWEERQAHYGDGLTVLYANQCRYFDEAVRTGLEVADEVGVEECRAVTLNSAQEVQDLAPCPYGTLCIVYDGQLLAYTPLSAKKLKQRLEEQLAGG